MDECIVTTSINLPAAGSLTVALSHCKRARAAAWWLVQPRSGVGTAG
jgi:hypothetical protein